MGAPTAYAPQMSQMSYVPQAMPQQPFMDVNVIKQQQTDATTALTNQAGLQANMLKHQYDAQIQMLQAECDRNTQMATAQFQQQLSQSKMALEQQKLQME